MQSGYVLFLFLTANDMHSFMLYWYEKFPTFKSRELFLTGESYAGWGIVDKVN